ncbi:MAG: hydrogenase maturation nickel metallochaperone HypA [Candidatus Dormibacteria bacterium]
MHELSITRNIVAIVGDRANGAKVTRVTLEVGTLSAVVPDAIRFCFDIVARGTALEGAALDIIEVPGLARCRRCGGEVQFSALVGGCPCGSGDMERLRGEELTIKEMVTL